VWTQGSERLGLAMLNYYLASAVFNGLSAHPGLRAAYRAAGNKKTVRPITLGYTRWVWEQAAKADCLGPGNRILELGTGWTHANSLYIGLLGHAAIDTFDVVDNRSLASLQHQVPLVLGLIRESADHSSREKSEAERRAGEILQATTLERVYEILHMSYQVGPKGAPSFPDASFDFVFSMDVLEHVRREHFQESVKCWKRLLKPGGAFASQVGLDDHLSHLDHSKHVKHYLQHSKRMGRYLVECDLKYINRLSASEILAMFRRVGFAITSTERELCDMTGITVHPDYAHQSPDDLAAARLAFVARA
jgi:SAM-dependent methyltransferase